MKKFISILLTITIFMPFAIIASAKDINTIPTTSYTEQYVSNSEENSKDVTPNTEALTTQSKNKKDEVTEIVNPNTDPTNPMNWVKTIFNSVLSFLKGFIKTAIAYIKGERVVTSYPFWWSQQT